MPIDDRELALVDHAPRLRTASVTMRNQPLPGPPLWASM